MITLSQVAVAADYKLTTEDQLYISVWGHPDLQQEVVVGPDGQISFPLIGKVEVKGLTINQFTSKITKQLQEYIKINESKVNVVLRKYKTLKVKVLGAVKKPGVYQIINDKQVLDLISLAGGTTEIADLNDVRLTRKDKSLAINLEAVLEGRNQEQNYRLEAGDTIYVPKGLIEVNILGAVRQAGSFKVRKGTRVRALLARAGDVTDQASNQIKYIYDGEEETLSLEQLFNNRNQNPVLQDGATIRVLENKYYFRKMSFWRNLFFFVGGLNQIKDLVE